MANINVKLADGTEKQAELLRKVTLNNKEYALYTLNETTNNGLIKIYASEIINNNNIITYNNIATDEEWNQIKDEMRKIISGEGVN